MDLLKLQEELREKALQRSREEKAANKAKDTASKEDAEAVVPEVQIPTAEDYLADIRDLLVEQNKAAQNTETPKDK